MSKSAQAAKVMYCGHNGWFLADIYAVAGANVIRPNGPVTPGNITRGRNEEATHHLVDFPSGGFWRPELGVFVVPEDQVEDLRAEATPPPKKARPKRVNKT